MNVSRLSVLLALLCSLSLSRNSAAEAPKYVVTEWAVDPSIANSVGITLDDQGRAYVTVAKRRKQSSLDIRHHQNLVKKDLSLTTVEERRAWYREYLTGQGFIPDRNKDGKRDWRDLTVQKDSVVQVTDADGDGKSEGFRALGEYNTEVTGIAAGVLAVENDVFVAVEPDFIRYVDKDGDGFPEKHEVVATGFQVHMGQGGHNLSGVTLGPDGRVYWSLGDKGHFVKTKEGRTYHMPNSGAIFRCEMDGSLVERFSSGERNAQELGFDSFGNLFSMDNDGDYPGEKERALYITEGSMHGWRLNWQWLGKQDFTKISGLRPFNPWMDEKLFLPDREDFAAYLTPTIGNFGPGPCGFTANPGTALSPELSDCFFMTNQKSEVRVFRFKPKGAFFSFEEAAPIKGGVSNTGLAIGPDGALYSASYGGRKGVIHRFDVDQENRHPAREETAEILASKSAHASIDHLKAWLDHPDQRVRMKGQFELVRREKGEQALGASVTGAKTLVGKLHALWGIGQLARKDEKRASLPLVLPAFESGEAEIVAQACKVIGDAPTSEEQFLEPVRAALKHDSPRVQFFAAIALGNCADKKAVSQLIKLLATGGSQDPYLRHAAVMGLTGTMSAEDLAALSNHESRSVRMGAVVAMRRQRAPEIRAFLKDKDELILLEAARAIHDDQSIPDALHDLSGLLNRPGLSNEFLMRRVINAAFRHGSGIDLQRLEDFLRRGEASPKMKRTALASILWWSQPPVLDAVEGRYRKHAPRDRESMNAAIARLRPLILADKELQEVLLNGVAVRGEAAWLEGTSEHFDKLSAGLQMKVLDALAKTNSPELKSFVEKALASSDAKVQEKAREYALDAGVALLEVLLGILNDPKAAGQGKAVMQLAKMKEEEAKKKFESLVKSYRDGKAVPEWKLELWQAAKEQGIELPASADRFEFGGDVARGRELVLKHAAAQCIRCHQVGKDGSNLGPNLSKIGKDRKRSHLVASMLEPNKEITPGYGTIVVKTKDGKEISGVLTRKEKTIWIITQADNSKEIVNPKNIASHTVTSTMPPMGLIMKPEEIRDVVSYLATLK